MAIVYLGNGNYKGLSGDTKPTTAATNSILHETDTDDFYLYTGAIWVLLIANDKTETLNNKTIDADDTGNTIINIDDSNIKTAAAIAESKIAVKQGTSTQSGDGSTTVFNIAHGFGSTPTSFYATVASSDASGSAVITADATNIIITYPVAPPSGSSNLVWKWRVS